MTKTSVIWTVFALISVLTPVVYSKAWAVPGYLAILSGLAIAAALLGAAALRFNRFNVWSVLAVLAGLILGQWWVIQYLILMGFWKWRGFGP